VTLMNPHNSRDKSNNRTAKTIAAIPIAGIVIAASLLLSGLSIVGSYHLVLAQQNMTGGGVNATTTGAAGVNATTTAAGVNESELRLHLEEVRTALQNNDIQGAMMHLDLALNLLGGGTQGNMTSTTGSTNSTA
jgi:hypothetical protein